MSYINFVPFNVKFFEGVADEIMQFDRTGIYPLNDYKNAIITLADKRCVGEYNGYQIDIIRKENGKLARKFFAFDEHFYIGQKPKDFYGYKIVDCCCEQKGVADWFRNEPSQEEIKKMAETIFKFIKLWK